MDWVTTYLSEFWQLTAEMAPYLLLGFAIAGLLRVWLSPAWVERHLGKRSNWQNIKASLIGVPIPLCSCGIIPVSAAIRRQGGSRGSVASFTASTPQTGVDSILATWAMLGPLFTGIRIIAAFFSGWLAGGLVNRFEPRGDDQVTSKASPTQPAQDCCCESEGGGTCCAERDDAKAASFASKIRDGLGFGLMTLPRDIAGSLLLGIGLGALITTVVPANYFAGTAIPVWLTYFAVMLFAVPLYVCSTGSIPMAFAFVQAGLSPGAALVFLISGPATNTATFVALVRIIGKRATILYLVAILVTGIAAGFVLDLFGTQMTATGAHFHQEEPTWWMHLSGALLVAMLGIPTLQGLVAGRGSRRQDSEEDKECCRSSSSKEGNACGCSGESKKPAGSASMVMMPTGNAAVSQTGTRGAAPLASIRLTPAQAPDPKGGACCGSKNPKRDTAQD